MCHTAAAPQPTTVPALQGTVRILSFGLLDFMVRVVDHRYPVCYKSVHGIA
jgi:hypothetical protein